VRDDRSAEEEEEEEETRQVCGEVGGMNSFFLVEFGSILD